MNNYNLYFVEEIDSTNKYLKKHYDSIPSNTYLYTSFQTNGSGRMGRNWESEKGKNIMMSLLIKDHLEKCNIDLVTLMVSVAIHKVLSNYLDNIYIKWPNDILCNHKKLCGILCEAISSDKVLALVIGIGINVNQKEFSKDISDICTSIVNETGKSLEVPSLIDEVIKTIQDEINTFYINPLYFMDYYKQHLYGLNQIVSYTSSNQLEQGEIIGISDNGSIIIKTSNGSTVNKRSGEIKIITNYNL